MTLLALVAAWIGAVGLAPAANAISSPSAAAQLTYTYDDLGTSTEFNTDAVRGPPGIAYDYTGLRLAVDSASYGLSAHARPGPTLTYNDCGHPAQLTQFAQVAAGSGTTRTASSARAADERAVSGSRCAANGVSRLVPAVGLAAHEAAGGRVLARHVGMTHADLLARLSAQPGITGASSFSSRAVAESSAAGLLDANASDISSWLAGSGGKLVLNGTGGITGRYVAQGSTSISNVTGVRAVLVRDANMSIGYRIQTAFPTP